MATTTGKTRCIICDKEKATSRCGGCLEDFCYKHLGTHQQQLNKQLDEIEVNRDIFRQSLTTQIEQPNNHLLIQQIDKWEQDSIKKIQQTAEEARKILLNNTNEYIQNEIEIKLNKLTNQLRETRRENDFNEINLRQFEEELKQLTKELNTPSNISIREDFTPFINKLSVNVSGKYVILIPITENNIFLLKSKDKYEF